jgi:L,D-peptidoglycan transpeptidase YkuD (ErfK/YbiS/YcfS/YnhG family)
LGALAVLFIVRRDPEPASTLLGAEQYLNLARLSKADLDATVTYEQAVRKVRDARSAMMLEYGKPAFLRSYGETRRLLLEGHRLTTQALEEARTEISKREARLQDEMTQIRADASEVRDLLLRLPPRYQRALRHVVSAESRITAAEAKLSSRESRDALDEMHVARSEVSLALRDVRGLLIDFLGRRSEWTADLRRTLEWSRTTGGTAFIVDKLNHKGHLVRNGRSQETFALELGPGWLDRKIREGDRATPEGRYQIVRKKGNGQTRYHKAMLLNYPNDEDHVRFRRLRNNGMVSRGARIGGLIEIHGDGGKGEDWTFGCISLRDRDMDRVFGNLAVGSPVTIIGVWEEPAWLTRLLETASR